MTVINSDERLREEPRGEATFDVLTPAPGLTTIPNLPDLTAPVTIDGYTQQGAQVNTLPQGDNAVLKIVLNGTPVRSPRPQQACISPRRCWRS